MSNLLWIKIDEDNKSDTACRIFHIPCSKKYYKRETEQKKTKKDLIYVDVILYFDKNKINCDMQGTVQYNTIGLLLL